LPGPLARVYGPLRMPRRTGRPWVIGNFATTLDGVVALKVPGPSAGGEITGSDPHDRLLMGLLRAAADAVIVGAGTLRAVPRHRWTAEHVYPPMAEAFAELRHRLGKPPRPWNVIVTSSGEVDLALPVFSDARNPVVIVTTGPGARRLAKARSLPNVRVAASEGAGPLSARTIVEAVAAGQDPALLLVEGGPHLMGSFFADRSLDELFLTVAPQVAGRDDPARRPGLVAGRTFAPEDPRWGDLVGIRRRESHLFLRFAFPAADANGSDRRSRAAPGLA
jgi:riboflavin biosynthesis pyrimidine reductase